MPQIEVLSHQVANGSEKSVTFVFRTLSKAGRVCVSGGKKCSFFGKFGVLCILVTSVLRFALLSYYRRTIRKLKKKL